MEPAPLRRGRGLSELSPTHELSHLRRALEFVTNFGFAVDGGAHKGIWTRELLKRFATVAAFEPVDENFAHLPDCLKFRAALGDKGGFVSMSPGPRNTGQYHVVEGDEVPIVRLDDFRFPAGFVKLDVEGMEYRALLGAEETIRKHCPVVVIEETGLSERYGVPQGAASRLLESWGFSKAATCNKNHIYQKG